MITSSISDPPIVGGDVMSTQLMDQVTTVATPARSLSLFDSVEVSGASRPDALLQRDYPVASYDWVPGAPFNTLLGTVAFPDALFAQPFIRSKLVGYRFFSCEGVEVRVQLGGQPMSYGAIMISFDPATGYDVDAMSATDVVTSSSYPHVLASASSDETHTFIVPYLSPDARIDLVKWRSAGIGTVDISVAAPLVQALTPTPTPLRVTVFARFLNPQADVPSSSVMMAQPSAVTKAVRPVSW